MASMSPTPSLLIGTRAAGDGRGECQEERSGPIGLSCTARFISKLPLIISSSLSNILHHPGLEFFLRKFAAESSLVVQWNRNSHNCGSCVHYIFRKPNWSQITSLPFFCLKLHAIILWWSTAEGILKMESIIRHWQITFTVVIQQRHSL